MRREDRWQIERLCMRPGTESVVFNMADKNTIEIRTFGGDKLAIETGNPVMARKKSAPDRTRYYAVEMAAYARKCLGLPTRHPYVRIIN